VHRHKWPQLRFLCDDVRGGKRTALSCCCRESYYLFLWIGTGSLFVSKVRGFGILVRLPLDYVKI
jgi:hypothetical protein